MYLLRQKSHATSIFVRGTFSFGAAGVVADVEDDATVLALVPSVLGPAPPCDRGNQFVNSVPDGGTDDP